MLIRAGSSGCGSGCQAHKMPNLRARFAMLSRPGRFAVLLVSGVIAGLGQAPFDLWPATIVALAVAFVLHGDCRSARQAAGQAWFFGLGYFAFTLRWIIEPFLVDVARHGWMAPFALLLMAGGAALFWAVAAYLAGRLMPRNIAMFGLMLVGAEVTRSLILSGFPWALLGHIWVPTALAQLAALGGPHLLSLITVLVAWSVALMVAGRWAGGLGIVALMVVAGFVVRPGPPPAPMADAPIVRLVQPNAPQHLKWDPAYRDVFLNRLVALTGQGPVPDLIVWPETAVPSLLNYIVGDMSLLEGAARGAPLVFGIQRRDDIGQFYNSFVVMGQGGAVTGIYDKRHLVPFGEYIPGGNLVGQFGISGLATTDGGGFAAGAAHGLITLPGIGPAIPLICYEGIFAEEIARGTQRPRLMVLITNDAWFGTAAGPYQHLAQARLRSIEQGLPMVRVANTGVSAMIDARGRLRAQIPLDVEGAVDVPLPPALAAPVYTRWGDWPVILLLVAAVLSGAFMRQRDSD